MFLLFSPFSFLFSCTYLAILRALIRVSDFIYFWLLMEFLILLFMGVSYTVFTSKISSLIVYFFIQSLSSFLILVSFFLKSPEFFSLSLFLKLGMFPFIAWYISSLHFFPTPIFLLASTLQKLPAIFLLLNTGIVFSVSFFWISAIFGFILRGVLMLSSQSIRLLLVASSVSNNGWLLLASQASLLRVSIFVTVYFSLLFIVLKLFSQLSEVTHFTSHLPSLTSLTLLCSLSGVPPSPLFLGKIYIILRLFDCSHLVWPLASFLVLRVACSSAYICFRIKLFVNNFRV